MSVRNLRFVALVSFWLPIQIAAADKFPSALDLVDTPRLATKMNWSEAQGWLSGRGCEIKPDLRPDLPGSLIAWCTPEPKIEITFDFVRPGDSHPARCISLAFAPTGVPNWKPTVAMMTGIEVKNLPKPPGDLKPRRFTVKGPSGSVTLLLGSHGRDVSIGEKCAN